MTLLTPADDPETFELVASNLKTKARGNQKSNEANHIKSNPHDTENHEKNFQNQRSKKILKRGRGVLISDQIGTARPPCGK